MSESSDTDFGDQENDALVLDVGDDSVTDKNFVWEDMNN
jgi:hypothetical protein